MGETEAIVFFFRQKTAYEIKECDWSSDVCSSDLYKNLQGEIWKDGKRIDKGIKKFRTSEQAKEFNEITKDILKTPQKTKEDLDKLLEEMGEEKYISFEENQLSLELLFPE